MTPFRFFTRLSLRFIEHKKARTAGDLVDGLKSPLSGGIAVGPVNLIH